jgi:hypothetical protein
MSGVETDVQFEVWQDGDMVASADALSDAEHFMLVYGQDGPVEAKTAITTRVPGFHDAPPALSAIEGGGEPITAAIIEDALRHRLSAKDGRVTGFADAADDVLSIIRAAATPPATPIAGGDRGKMAHIIGRAITSYEDDPSPDCTTAKQNAVSKATDAILGLIAAARAGESG